MTRISILHPEYSWHTTPTILQLQNRISVSSRAPRLRRVAPFWLQRIRGYIHKWLIRVSIWYCRWYDIECPGQIWQLPFGLLLKYSDGTRIEEVVTTRAAYDAGLPVPKIVSYGAHPETPMAPLSILMTRLPGCALFGELWQCFTPEEKQTAKQQLTDILGFIHSWTRPPCATSDQICSILGTSIRSHRVPFSNIPPCLNESEFNRRLIEPAEYERDRWPDFETRMASVADLNSLSHEVIFTHGDFAPRNIMVMDDGRIAGLIDWEAAGYYPEYWEYTTAWRVSESGWWYELVKDLAGGKYNRERKGDAERWKLTNGTML